LSIIHHLHRLRIQYGKATKILLIDLALIGLIIAGSLEFSSWFARYWPIQ
jgi:hypothetical protein